MKKSNKEKDSILTLTKKFCIVIQPRFNTSLDEADFKLQEAISLTKALNLECILSRIITVKETNPSLLLGKGQVELLKDFINTSENKIDVVLINDSLSPIQQRNLENNLNCKVIDRIALILNIFAERAKTKEGKLQVELAYLTYQKSRLVKAWSHLERQRGGGGFVGGPGETQKELDKRIITNKITKLKDDLKNVEKTRTIQRKSRKKIPYKIVSLVGYTNAGKSTLFNKLTNENVFAKDLLFATLDPTMRLLNLPNKQKVIISDTVGFVSDLPHQLVSSFKATLEEVLEADLLIHVIDASNKNYLEQKQSVKNVLKELGINEIHYNEKCLEVYNKSDKLSVEQQKFFKNKYSNNILISATTNNNLDLLIKQITNYFLKDFSVFCISINLSNKNLVSEFYKKIIIVKQKVLDNNFLEANILASETDINKLLKKYSGDDIFLNL